MRGFLFTNVELSERCICIPKKEVDKKALRGARLAVLGFGSQGRAHPR